MSDVKSRLEQFPAVRTRPDLLVNISVGQGNWATVPWIALLNTKITRSTQEGIYVVFLIATSLDRIFLTLNQGTTNLVRTLGQPEAQKRMLDVARKTRALVHDLGPAGFILDNEISLGGNGWLAKNYEIGTIAHTDFSVDDIPDDNRMNDLLKVVLDAYDRAVDLPQPESPTLGLIGSDAAPTPEPKPYEMDDALSELFLEQPILERLLAIWTSKKNLILQGAPGVGKSFVAKRLAYLLLEAKDTSRVETIQFHQSYSYEDFVQGFRPDGKGGFTLRDGVFHRFCEKASLSPSRPHVFIIDEINRGNLSKVLGELIPEHNSLIGVPQLCRNPDEGPPSSKTRLHSVESRTVDVGLFGALRELLDRAKRQVGQIDAIKSGWEFQGAWGLLEVTTGGDLIFRLEQPEFLTNPGFVRARRVK